MLTNKNRPDKLQIFAIHFSQTIKTADGFPFLSSSWAEIAGSERRGRVMCPHSVFRRIAATSTVTTTVVAVLIFGWRLVTHTRNSGGIVRGMLVLLLLLMLLLLKLKVARGGLAAEVHTTVRIVRGGAHAGRKRLAVAVRRGKVARCR